MKSVKKRLIIFICVISVLVGSFSLPLKTKAVVGTAVAAFTLSEILTYVISGIAAVGVTVGLNELLDSDEEMYALVNHYLSDTSGIVIDESRRTLVKDEQEISIEDWIDGLGNKYGSQMADQSGDDFLNKLQDMDLRLTYDRQYFDIADGYILTDHDREALGTDKLYITEEEFQELLYALYLKNHGLLKENEENLPSPSPDQGDDDNNKHKLNWKTLAVTTASIPVAALAVGGKSFFENVGDFFKELLNDDTDPLTQVLQGRYITDDSKPHYYGSYEMIDDKYNIEIYGQYNFSSGYCDKYIVNSTLSTELVAGFFNDSNQSLTFYELLNGNIRSLSFRCNFIRCKPDGSVYYESSSNFASISNSQSGTVSYSVNFPVFSTYEEMKAFLKGEADDSTCINREYLQTYQDPDNDYGWASSAAIDPAAIPAAMPDLAESLDGRDVSIAALVDAIESLKNQLEEQNPNTDPAVDPVPYPTIADYADTLQDVITDPDIFPESDPAVDPAPDPDPGTETAPDSDTMKDYSGFLGKIITLLQNILQAIKDFFSWFIIDFDAIKQHLLLALSSVPAFSGYEDFLALIDSAKGQVTDSYDYPVIEMDTPEILLPYYKHATIVLLDFEDYATYFIWVRTAMAFAILFGFCMWLIRDIKVSFTLN